MALIGKIREKSALLVIIIGVALLAFILGDWKSFSGGRGDQIGYGTISGESVDFAAYEEMAQNVTDQDKNNAAQQQKEFTQKDQDASNDKAWNYLVETTVIDKEIEALNLNVGKNEFDAYLFGREGFQVMQDLAQNFTDSATGQFNAKLLQQRIDQMENSKEATERDSWEKIKKDYSERRRQEKYFSLLAQGVYVTKLEAEEDYVAQKEIKSVSFVAKRYTDLADDKITVKDEEVKEYYNEHKTEKQYENKFASRDVRYFDISVEPSKSDIKSFNDKMTTLKKGFAATTKDSLFILKNSEFKFYQSNTQATFKPEGDEKARQGLTYPAIMDSVFKNASVGQIVGPYSDNGTTRIAKVLGFNTNVLKARHILLSAPRADSAKVAIVRKTADSLVALINKDNFAEYVTKYTEDPGSKDKGGVYENFMDYEMVPEFSKFAVEKPIGTIGVVQTDFGFHIMEAMERSSVKFPLLAVVQQTLVPSMETVSETESKIYDLLYKIDARAKAKNDIKSKVAVFDTIASKAGYFVRPITITENKPIIYGFNTVFAEDKIIKMAFEEDVEAGTLCSAPIKDKNRYIIAMISSVKEAGTPTFEDVEESMRKKVIEEKKAKRFIALMNGTMSMDALAKKANSILGKAEVTFSNPQIGEAGYEPEIIGAIFSGLKDGQKTVPLKGKNGVYVVRIDKTTKAPATSNYTAERETLLASNRQSAGNLAKAALIEKAKVVDNRRFLKIGVRR
ncbi:MAG: peptidylprolyl isomerase [Crocinitomicaceae bacterium]